MPATGSPPSNTLPSSAKPLRLELRPATRTDLPTISKLWSDAFRDDPLIGDIMHPNREKYPQDFEDWFSRGVWERFQDYSHRLVVIVDLDAEDEDQAAFEYQLKGRVVGCADWRRLGSNWPDALYSVDPRNLLGPAAKSVNRVAGLIWPNRAANQDKEKASTLDNSLESTKKFYTGRRKECWDLYVCGVHPDYQGKGVGKKLVGWGLEQAKRENVAASVCCSKENGCFYINAGFQKVGGKLRENGDVDVIVFWDPPEKGDGLKVPGY